MAGRSLAEKKSSISMGLDYLKVCLEFFDSSSLWDIQKISDSERISLLVESMKKLIPGILAAFHIPNIDA
jgi:hypothetical protein